MALGKMGDLEARIRGLVSLVQDLKLRNAQLEEDLRTAKSRLSKQTELSRQWEEERHDIRSRIEKVLGELELFECLDEAKFSKEVALD
ncbi:MAG: cell division protein ZapB [Terriglobia bacterium]